MKKSNFFLLGIFLFSLLSCEKEIAQYDETRYPVNYNIIGTDEDVEIHIIRYIDENRKWQTVENPSHDWRYDMSVPILFAARIEMEGYIPKAKQDMGNLNAVVRIHGDKNNCYSTDSMANSREGEFFIDMTCTVGDRKLWEN